MTPPAVAPNEKPAPREVIFVIDNSGSMGGTSMVQAKASLIYALGRLQAVRPLQRHPLRQHHGRAVPRQRCRPTPEHVAQAKAFVSALQARGGTEMVPPMRAALTDRRGGDEAMCAR